MKLIFNFLIVIGIFSFVSSTIYAHQNNNIFWGISDIKSNLYTIVTSKNHNYEWSFVFCENNTKKVINCSPIGKKKYYSAEELDGIKLYEKIEFTGKLIAAGGAVIVGGTALISGAVAFGASNGTIALASKTAALIGGISLGGGFIASIPFWLDKLNPTTQFKQIGVLSLPGILNEEDIIKSNDEVLEIKELLMAVLD